MSKIEDGDISVAADYAADKAFPCADNDVWTLKWHDRTKKGEFLFIAKAWTSWWRFGKTGTRIYRLQSHQVTDGVLGRRHILIEVRNGKVVIEK